MISSADIWQQSSSSASVAPKLSKTCQPCKKRKKKCNGEYPCSRCVHLEEADLCVYRLEKRRGPPARALSKEETLYFLNRQNMYGTMSPLLSNPGQLENFPGLPRSNAVATPEIFQLMKNFPQLHSQPQMVMNSEFRNGSDDRSHNPMDMNVDGYVNLCTSTASGTHSLITANAVPTAMTIQPISNASMSILDSSHSCSQNDLSFSSNPTHTAPPVTVIPTPTTSPTDLNALLQHHPISTETINNLVQTISQPMTPFDPTLSGFNLDPSIPNPSSIAMAASSPVRSRPLPLQSLIPPTKPNQTFIWPVNIPENLSLAPETAARYVDTFFDHFYPIMPIIDKITFQSLHSQNQIPEFFYLAVIAFGALKDPAATQDDNDTLEETYKMAPPQCHVLTARAEKLLLPFLGTIDPHPVSVPSRRDSYNSNNSSAPGSPSCSVVSDDSPDSDLSNVFVALTLALLSSIYYLRSESSRSWLFHQMSFHWFLRSWNHKQMNDSLSKLDLSGPSSDTSNSTAELEHELLSRCFWSLLIMDRIVATAESRSPFMTLDNVKPLPRYPNFDNDIPPEYKNNSLILSHFHPKLLFRMLVRISLLVSKVEEWSRKSFMKAKGLNTRENDPADVALDLGLQNSNSNSMNVDSPTGSDITQEQFSLLLDFHAFAESFKPPQLLEFPVSPDSKELALQIQIPDIRSPFINTMFLSTNWIFRIIQIFLETDILKKWEAIKIILCTVPKTFSPFSSYILRITTSAALELITDNATNGESPTSMGVPKVESVMCWLTDALEHLDSGFWAVPEDINFIRNAIQILHNYRH